MNYHALLVGYEIDSLGLMVIRCGPFVWLRRAI